MSKRVQSRQLDLFNLSTVFEVCDVGQGNLAISKLLAQKKMYLFCNLHTLKCNVLHFWEVVHTPSFSKTC
jgi:hypothetical protein